MALKPCRECGSQVSTRAKVCPQCGIGWPAKKHAVLRWTLWIFGSIVIGLVNYWRAWRPHRQQPPQTFLSRRSKNLRFIRSSIANQNLRMDPLRFQPRQLVPEQRALDGTAIKAETHFAESNVPLLVEFSTSDSIKTTAIEGRTNLPDGTRLFVGLSAPPLPNGEPMCRNAMWQYEVAVSDGAFKAGPFPCRLGFYTLTLSTPAAEFQPENVQAVIGLHGENLEGPYVEADCARSCPKRMPALGRSIY